MKRNLFLAIFVILLSNYSVADLDCKPLLSAQKIDNIGVSNNSSVARTNPEDASALDLALTLGLDPELSKLVENPRIAQYIYLNYFAEKVSQGELRVALSDLVKDFEVNHLDLFNLINKELQDALNDPEVKAKVKALRASTTIDQSLRPKSYKAATDFFFSQIKQALNFIPSVKKSYSLIKDGISLSSMYEGLFHFYGATQLGLKDSQLRPWDTTPDGFADVRPDQIRGMSPMGWTNLAYFASETEAPIVNYSTTSGEATRGLNKALSVFLGTTWEEFEAYSEMQQKDLLQGFLQYDSADFCTAVWCKEERRHDPTLMYVAQQIWGMVREEEKTYTGPPPITDYTTTEAALKHLAGRNASEWSANSIYFFLRSHSVGPANQWVDQPRIDETKHMAIFSAAHKYFTGTRLWSRTVQMLEAMKVYKKQHKESNSIVNEALAEKMSLFELTVIHLFIEYRVRKFIKSIPLKTMAKFFERDPVAMAERDESDLDKEKKRRLEASLASEAHKGRILARWPEKERKRQEELREFERENKGYLESLIMFHYKSFFGAETPESPEDIAFRKDFTKLKHGKGKAFDRLIQDSLNATLTDYQIMNNRWVLSQDNLVVDFSSIEVGFEVRHRGDEEVDVLAVERITKDHSLLRINKPQGLVYTAGASFKVSIPISKEVTVTRMLSVANSPKANFMEFAMADSDSDFKQALAKLNEGSRVHVELLSEGLDFSSDRPMVFIAGGIGITPFRSFIQERFSQTAVSKPEVTLVYANRTIAPFESEFVEIEETHGDFNFHQIRSTQLDEWSGPTGRINSEFLSEMFGEDLNNKVFYIVGTSNMSESMKDILLQLGVEDSDIKLEKFTNTSKVENRLQMTAPSLLKSPVTDERNLCACTETTRSQIQESIDRGNSTLEMIRTDLGRPIAGNCGQCKAEVLNMIEKK